MLGRNSPDPLLSRISRFADDDESDPFATDPFATPRKPVVRVVVDKLGTWEYSEEESKAGSRFIVTLNGRVIV